MAVADHAVYQDAGLYDPGDERAAQRLELLEHLAARGVSIEEMVEAEREGRLPLVAAELRIRGGRERFTLAEACARTGIAPDAFWRVWRADGFPDPGDTPVFTEADLEVFGVFHAARDIFGEQVLYELARVCGSSMARIAEAGVAAIASKVGASLLDEDAREVEVARAMEQVVEILPRLSGLLDSLHRHHIEAAVRRIAAGATGMGLRRSATELAVGFADLSGYTALSARLTMEELAATIGMFDALAADTVVAAGGRVVKLIGDEVMFVVRDAAAGCATALALRDAIAAHPDLPALRTAVAYGELLARDGDYYGPVVNLAARAVATASPGTVLTDAVTVHAVKAGERGGAYAFEAAGEHVLKGFDAPVELYVLERVPG